MPAFNAKTLKEADEKLRAIGYTKCETQHVDNGSCYHKGETGTHLRLYKQGKQIRVDLIEGN